MKKATTALQELRGVGDVLAQRLAEAGCDTFAKVAAAGQEGLAQIRGINPRMLDAIVAQARELAGEADREGAQRGAELRQRTDALKELVQNIALSVRDRFEAEAAGKRGRKVAKEIVKVIAALDSVEGKLESRPKKAGKGIRKADNRLSGLAGADLKGIGKGLRKARRALERVYA